MEPRYWWLFHISGGMIAIGLVLIAVSIILTILTAPSVPMGLERVKQLFKGD